jgi:sigma-B regulation protein RsbU (phosphoserine phosphatase)
MMGLFQRARKAPPAPQVVPLPAKFPKIPGLDLGAVYYTERKGGDFFDFCEAGPRLAFLLTDISGERSRAFGIAAAVQREFRSNAPKLLCDDAVNEADAVVELSLLLNRAVLDAAAGVCHAPAFVGSYNPLLGTLCYCNAGHVPGFVRDGAGITELPANGLPFGLFSHATRDALMSVLAPGAAFLLVSRGVIEGRCRGEDYGVEGVRRAFERIQAPNAHRLCVAVLDEVERFMCAAPTHNDVTALALVRSPA